MKRRLALATASLAVSSLLATAIAVAYSATYVAAATWGPGAEAHSGFTTGLLENDVQFDNRFGGTPYMGTNYEDSSGGYYLTWNFENDGLIHDTRKEFNYGAAACRASGGNSFNVYVTSCFTTT
jgi:hypothetical protein